MNIPVAFPTDILSHGQTSTGQNLNEFLSFWELFKTEFHQNEEKHFFPDDMKGKLEKFISIIENKYFAAISGSSVLEKFYSKNLKSQDIDIFISGQLDIDFFDLVRTLFVTRKTLMNEYLEYLFKKLYQDKQQYAVHCSFVNNAENSDYPFVKGVFFLRTCKLNIFYIFRINFIIVNYIKDFLPVSPNTEKNKFSHHIYSPFEPLMSKLSKKNFEGDIDFFLDIFKTPHLDFIQRTFDFCELKLVYNFKHGVIFTVYEQYLEILEELKTQYENHKPAAWFFANILKEIDSAQSILKIQKEELLKKLTRPDKITISVELDKTKILYNELLLFFKQLKYRQKYLSERGKEFTPDDVKKEIYKFAKSSGNLFKKSENFLATYISLLRRTEYYHEKGFKIEDPSNFLFNMETILLLNILSGNIAPAGHAIRRGSLILHKNKITPLQYFILNSFFEGITGEEGAINKIIETIPKMENLMR